jgi:hypothetical protein
METWNTLYRLKEVSSVKRALIRKMFLKINFLHEKQKEMVQLKLKVN